jgi:class 3 adenylate cyclase
MNGLTNQELIDPLVFEYEGTIDRFIGDGIMMFFNDPVKCSDPSKRAVEMSIEIRQRIQSQSKEWEKLGFNLGFGLGIAEGYTTMGMIGFKDRIDYSSIGSVPNLSARLCGEAKDGQILVSSRVAASLEGVIELEPVGDLNLRGFHKPVPAFNVP